MNTAKKSYPTDAKLCKALTPNGEDGGAPKLPAVKKTLDEFKQLPDDQKEDLREAYRKEFPEPATA